MVDTMPFIYSEYNKDIPPVTKLTNPMYLTNLTCQIINEKI